VSALRGRRRDGGGRRRRQWGSDRHQDPLPAVPRVAADWLVGVGRVAVAVSTAAWVTFMVASIMRDFSRRGQDAGSVVQTAAFLLLVTLLAVSALAYMTARLGFYYRARTHRRAARATLDEFFASRQPTLTALVPSYQEDARVIRMTLLSAALQEYPDLHVVLLIDDPPNPRYAGPNRLLQSARALPGEIEMLLAAPGDRFSVAAERFAVGRDGMTDAIAAPDELMALAAEYEYGGRWLTELADGHEVVDHTDEFFKRHVLGRLAGDLSLTATALRSAAADRSAALSHERLEHLYRRLAWTFTASLTSFERKRYVSLSHEANKAMNLNSYIGLLGGRYREADSPIGRTLSPTDGPADLVVPAVDYVLTLDADSVILPEYCARLVLALEQAQNARVGVAQTPYSAYPGAATRLERIAGATTDLQHILHQGMTFHNATFWVGANAVLRKRALDESVQVEYAGDWPIRRYIQDRTVIEDTESSIDLATHGWSLLNYPERLSYSATPPDFGSLCIQRHRWANGGLLIVPKLWRLVRERRARGERTTIGEFVLRVNYMASIFWCSLALLVLLAYHANGAQFSPFVLAIAAPYFLTMALDLRYCGYKALDVVRIYAFNLLLLPVNLSGALASIVQGLTGSKGRFRRTPKVRSRTTPGLVYVVLPYGIVALAVYTGLHAYALHRFADAAFAAVNAVLASYAIVAFVGLRNSLVDIWVNVIALLYKPSEPRAVRTPRQAPPASAVAALPLSDWERVLYVGSVDAEQHAAPHPSKPAADEPRAFTAWTDGRAAAMGVLDDECSAARGRGHSPGALPDGRVGRLGRLAVRVPPGRSRRSGAAELTGRHRQSVHQSAMISPSPLRRGPKASTSRPSGPPSKLRITVGETRIASRRSIATMSSSSLMRPRPASTT
jgi:cellulose synthase/poly-beta-1,6-N-acetylglucosamine synthase-like glycosyltransferase